jgi:hypothetical protein
MLSEEEWQSDLRNPQLHFAFCSSGGKASRLGVFFASLRACLLGSASGERSARLTDCLRVSGGIVAAAMSRMRRRYACGELYV